MKRDSVLFSAALGQYKTRISALMGSDFLKRAEDYRSDSKKDVRCARHYCRTCFYLVGRIGGAAITTQSCGLCLNSQTYGSTVTDLLCIACAASQNLCAHCGGDFDQNMQRESWPQATASDSTE
jgi:hypothetical protein